MEIYPNSESCPPNIFNLWRPFTMEKYNVEYEEKSEELNIL
jgi:hypothetical protein